MKITIITGSPHPHGTTALLTENFIKGAESKGHLITRFDAARMNIHPCAACNHCIAHSRACVYRDDMSRIRAAIMDSDMVVFVTPLYYFGMSAYLKAVIDRFYAFNDDLLGNHKKTILIAASGDNEPWTMDALETHYRTLCKYLKWDIQGILLAKGVYIREDIEATDYPARALELGASIE